MMQITLAKDIRDLALEFHMTDRQYWLLHSRYQKAGTGYIQEHLPDKIALSLKTLLSGVSLGGVVSVADEIQNEPLMILLSKDVARILSQAWEGNIFLLPVSLPYLVVRDALTWKKEEVILELCPKLQNELRNNPKVVDFFNTIYENFSIHFLATARKYLDRTGRYS